MAWRVRGQDHLVRILRQALAQGRVAHAYLLVGPPQVGKETLALDLAQALNCTGEEPPCGGCVQCRRIQEGKHAGVATLRVESSAEGRSAVEIGIDQVREVQHSAALPPYEGRCRLYIIDGVEMLSLEAANALLKNLEEPVPGVVFLLLTSDEESVLPTVRSRCQRLELRPLRLDQVAQVLREEHGQTPQQAEELAHFSQGCLGRAVQAARDPEVLGEWRQAEELAVHLEEASLEERFARAASLANRFASDRPSVRRIIGWWEWWWRDVLLTSYGLGEELFHQERGAALSGLARRLSPAEVLRRLGALRATRAALEANANPRLALEVLMLELESREAARRE